MIHRMRLIKLRDGLSEETIRTFLQVLNDTAKHIPAVRESHALEDVNDRREWSYAYYLQFDRVEDIKLYVDSEYHLKVVVPYFRDGPQKVVERTTSIAWEASAT